MHNREDWLLMALAHRRGQPITPAQIQKAMFLMRMEAGRFVQPGFYEFIPYNYGPFDATIYHDLDALASRGLVSGGASPGRNWKTYAVTAEGMAAAERVVQMTDPAATRFLHDVVDWVCSLSFPGLVRSIYAKYPEFKANSVFAG
jgi:hypothetical protein